MMSGNESRNHARCIPRAEVIAQLNDALRKTGDGGRIMVTHGVRRLDSFNAAALVAMLANYDNFDTDNDPHGERDFGDLEYAGAELLWKIDYYDCDLHYASSDPADAKVTRRVLTVMLASEY